MNHNLKTTFQLKKTGNRHTIVLRLNFGHKIVIATVGHKSFGSYKSHVISTKMDIDPKDWDSATKRPKSRKHKYTRLLDNIEELTRDVYYKYRGIPGITPELLINAIKKLVFGFQVKTEDVVFTPEDIKPAYESRTLPMVTGDAVQILDKKLEYDQKEEKKADLQRMKFLDYIKDVYLPKRTDLEKSSIKSYVNIQHFIRLYDVNTIVGDIDEQWVMKFMAWAKKQRKSNGDFYEYNYINSTIQKQLKAICRFLVSVEKLPIEIEWGQKDIRKSTVKTEEVALTIPQLKVLINLDLAGARKRAKDMPALELSRDLLVIGCLTSLRVSDLKNLHLEKLGKKKYQLNMVTQKTNTPIKFIVHERVADIWEKYNGAIPYQSDDKLNKNVKELGKLAFKKGHTEFGKEIIKKVVDLENKKKVIDTVKFKFYERLKSSSFRRTWATFAVQSQLMSPDMICKVTGHSRISQLMEYVKIDETELNQKLALLYKKINL